MSINDLRVHFCVTSSWVYSPGSDEEREEVFRMLRMIGIEESRPVAEISPYWWEISEEVRQSCAACVVSRANRLWVVFVNRAFPLTVRFVRPNGDQWVPLLLPELAMQYIPPAGPPPPTNLQPLRDLLFRVAQMVAGANPIAQEGQDLLEEIRSLKI